MGASVTTPASVNVPTGALTATPDSPSSLAARAAKLAFTSEALMAPPDLNVNGSSIAPETTAGTKTAPSATNQRQ